MKALVIGLGLSGTSAAAFLLQQGYQVIGVDEKQETVDDIKDFPCFFLDVSMDLSSIDLAILSPGISQQHPLCRKIAEHGIPLVGEAALAYQYLRQQSIGITGTNGKTTVTLLTTHILNTCGFPARSLGNIGYPLTKYLLNPCPEEIVVAELSSYQLETLSEKIFEAGIILNITPDHLDRYPSIDAYAKAKLRLQHCLKPTAPLYIHWKAMKTFERHLSHAHCIVFGDPQDIPSCYDSSLFANILPSRYNEMGVVERENAMAAWALTHTLGVSPKDFCQALSTFVKPPHRIEWVATIDGVDYINDSKGTNIDAVIAAVESMRGPTILIAGGVHKGSDYFPWIKAFHGKVKAIIAIGQATSIIEQNLKGAFPFFAAETLEHAINTAHSLAQPHDCVLLSPGCSSFDQFHNYAHRGETFKQCVYHLENRRTKL